MLGRCIECAYHGSAVNEARGIHSGKELPAPKQPLNISEVRYALCGLALFDLPPIRLTIVQHHLSTASSAKEEYLLS